MGFLGKGKSRRIRGAELVVAGGVTMFLSKIIGWLAPVALGVYGLYRILFKKSYKDGIVSLALGILLYVLFRGPGGYFLTAAMVTGGALLGVGAVMMILPSDKSKEIEIKPE